MRAGWVVFRAGYVMHGEIAVGAICPSRHCPPDTLGDGVLWWWTQGDRCEVTEHDVVQTPEFDM